MFYQYNTITNINQKNLVSNCKSLWKFQVKHIFKCTVPLVFHVDTTVGPWLSTAGPYQLLVYSEWPFDLDMAGKVALITGAAKGLGKEFCRVLLNKGARVS